MNKYRAWEPTEKRMVYEYDIPHMSSIDKPVERLAKFFCNIRNDSILMRYTGWVDTRNNRLIYEGDIVKITRYMGGNFVTYVHEYYRIAWHPRNWGWCMQPLDKELSMPPSCQLSGTEKSEVVGNIYENPELLKIRI